MLSINPTDVPGTADVHVIVNAFTSEALEAASIQASVAGCQRRVDLLIGGGILDITPVPDLVSTIALPDDEGAPAVQSLRNPCAACHRQVSIILEGALETTCSEAQTIVHNHTCDAALYTPWVVGGGVGRY